MEKIRVLCISHSAVVAAYRDRFEALSRLDDLEIHVLTPDTWVEGGGSVRCRPRNRGRRRNDRRLDRFHRGDVYRFGLSDRDSQTLMPGSASPIIEPGFAQCAVTTSPPSSSMSDRNLL